VTSGTGVPERNRNLDDVSHQPETEPLPIQSPAQGVIDHRQASRPLDSTNRARPRSASSFPVPRFAPPRCAQYLFVRFFMFHHLPLTVKAIPSAPSWPIGRPFVTAAGRRPTRRRLPIS
jgi:hypothetical protein